MPELCTASWRALFDHRGQLEVQPVRISRGVPKFWRAAEGFPAIDVLMPDGWMFGIDDMERFGRAYRRKLHQVGEGQIRARLDAIGAGRLALVCFEADPQGCHRGAHGFAGWWLRKTGELVEELELSNLAKTPHEPVGQLQLDVDQPRPTGAERGT